MEAAQLHADLCSLATKFLAFGQFHSCAVPRTREFLLLSRHHTSLPSHTCSTEAMSGSFLSWNILNRRQALSSVLPPVLFSLQTCCAPRQQHPGAVGVAVPEGSQDLQDAPSRRAKLRSAAVAASTIPSPPSSRQQDSKPNSRCPLSSSLLKYIVS